MGFPRRARAIGAGLVAVVVAGTLVLAGTARASTPPEPELPTAELQAALEKLVDTDVATAALARVRDGKAEWAGSAGVQDLESGKTPHPDGHFRIGSVTKTFVATVLMQLVDEGRLSLDDPIERHLPGVVPNGEAITVRQMLNHTSGLFNYTEALLADPDDALTALDRTYTPEELLKLAFAEDPYFAPGQDFHYSNTNYILAGLLIEELTGNPYGQEVERRILHPLGLKHTVVPGTDTSIPNPHAHGYVAVPSGEGEEPELVDVTQINPSGAWAAGEMISTTADLNRFYDALLTGELTSEASLAAMRDTVATGQPGTHYGLGLFETTLPCGVSVWGHNGGIHGFSTDVTWSENGRQLTLSLNPSTAPATPELLTGIHTTVYCDQ